MLEAWPLMWAQSLEDELPMGSCSRSCPQGEQGHPEVCGQASKTAGKKPAKGTFPFRGLTALQLYPNWGGPSPFTRTQRCSSHTPRSRPVCQRRIRFVDSPLGSHCRWSSPSW